MRKTSKRILIGFVLVIVGLIGLYAYSLSRSQAKLHEAYAALEADGRPMDAAAMIPPEVPDAENAALLYERAAASLKEESVGRENLLEYLSDLAGDAFRDSPDPNDRAELERRMEEDVVVRALADIEEGTKLPDCRFSRDYEAGLLTDLSTAREGRHFILILCARARLEAESGALNKAWKTAETQFAFADAFRHDPTCDSQFMREIMILYTCRLVQHLCEIAPPDANEYRQIEDILQGLDGIDPYVHAVDAERLLNGEWLFNLPPSRMYEALSETLLGGGGDVPEFLRRLVFRFVVYRPRLVADHAAYLQLMRKCAQLLESPYVPRDAEGYEEIWDVPGKYVLTHELSPFIDSLRRFYRRTMTELRLTRAGLGLIQYRQAHDAYPDTLDELGLEGLIDPFTGEPLHYRNEGEGFLVYGVNEDCQDDGGTEKESRKDEEFDILWRFPRQTDAEDADGQ